MLMRCQNRLYYVIGLGQVCWWRASFAARRRRLCFSRPRTSCTAVQRAGRIDVSLAFGLTSRIVG